MDKKSSNDSDSDSSDDSDGSDEELFPNLGLGIGFFNASLN